MVHLMIGDFPIALDAAFVKDIRKDRTLNELKGLPRLDLARWLGVEPHAGARRKILVVDLPGAPYLLEAGVQARIMTVMLSQLRSLPPFIAGLRHRSCLMGLILGDEGDLLCLLDAKRLPQAIETQEER